MGKTYLIGTIDPGNGKMENVFVRVSYVAGNLSIHGVVGPRKNGDCAGSCGQICLSMKPEEVTPTDDWTADMIRELWEIWDRWHLNDMTPGCEHQRNWDTKGQIKLNIYKWSRKYYDMRRDAEDGKLSDKDYADYRIVNKKVIEVTCGMNSPKYETPLVKELLDSGYIELKGTESKTAGWVRPEEHPDGLLCKPCEVCGYKYGTAWLKEEVPQEIISKLESFPSASVSPAWV